jgi:hypothetical protein
MDPARHSCLRLPEEGRLTLVAPGADRVFRPTSAFLWRLGFIVTGVAALVCGYLGIEQQIERHGGFARHPLDIVYYDLQLFVLGSPPLDDGGTFPVLLEIARFAAPAVTVYALVQAARALFAAEFMRLRTRYSRGHTVVCGSNSVAQALMSRLAEQGNRVVRVPADGTPVPTQRRSLFVPGTPTSVDVLRNAGLGRARTLYVCTDDSAQNLAVADLAARLRPQHQPALETHVQVDDPELCLALQARRLGLPSARTTVNFFSSHELAARKLLETQPPPAAGGRSPRIMVVGASWFGAALTVELARHWRLQDARSQRLLQVVMVDDAATAMVSRLNSLYPFLAETCHFTSHDLEVRTLLDGDLPEDPPDRVYLCCDDEEVSLKLALTMDHFWRRGPRSVVVRLSRLGQLDTVFDRSNIEPLLEGVSETLYLFDAVHAGSEPSLVEDSLVERLARAIHEHYLTIALREGTPWGASRAMYPWHQLDDDLKAANRGQAAHIGTKLQAVGCALAPNPIWGEPERLDFRTVEYLARMEHERWLGSVRDNGWTQGSVRDDAGKRHPDLLDWEQLAEPTRQKDRRAVTGLPTILADVGFQIVRIRPSGVPEIPHQGDAGSLPLAS